MQVILVQFIEHSIKRQLLIIKFYFPPKFALLINNCKWGTGYTSVLTVKVRQGNGGAIVPNVTATATLDGDSVDSISISGSGNNNLVGTFIIEISSPILN